MSQTKLFDRDPVRVLLATLIEERAIDMKSLSRQIDRNDTYIQQYLKMGKPLHLKEPERVKLAEILNIDEVSLGAPLRSRSRESRSPSPDVATIGEVTGRRGVPDDAIPEVLLTAGLGAGQMSIITEVAHKDGRTYAAEEVRDWWRLPDWLLRSRFNARPQHVACFPAEGDSMEPTIRNGDVVFVDLRHRVPSPPGLYALATPFGGVEVKRLEVISVVGEDPIRIRVQSDNPHHKPNERTLGEIAIVGRVLGRFTTD